MSHVARGQEEGWLYVYWQHSIAGLEPPSLSWSTMAWVALLHGLVVLWLLARQDDLAPVETPPLVVRLIMPEPAIQPDTQPEPLPVRQAPPKPVVKQITPLPRSVQTPEPVVAAPVVETHAPSPVAAAAPIAPPPVVANVAKADTPPAISQAEPTPVPKEDPVEQPRFDADYLDNPAPGYPPLSRKLREEGQVLLRVRVTAEGRAEQVNLHRPSGFERLDERALQTVRQWQFMPARQGGKPVDAWVIVPIQFSLKG